MSVMLISSLFQYIHDGSDSVKDSILFVARTAGVEWPDKDKTSVATKLEFNVVAVNDAIPKLINNTGLNLWAGSTKLIATNNLGAVDNDTPNTNLTFSISSPHCGMVSLASYPEYPVTKFTQTDINSNQVLFTHSGERWCCRVHYFMKITPLFQDAYLDISGCNSAMD